MELGVEQDDANDQTRVEMPIAKQQDVTPQNKVKKRWNKVKNILLGISKMKINQIKKLDKAVSW